MITSSVLVVVSGILIAGCTSTGVGPSATPTTSATTMATRDDAAALTAAIDVYTRYSAAFDLVLSKPLEDADYSRLRATVTDAYWVVLEGEFAATRRTWVQVGSTAFDQAVLENESRNGSDITLTISLCVDSSHVDLVDVSSAVELEDERRLRFPMTVELQGPNLEQLLMSNAVSSEGSNACDEA